jgi:hypothetical protein
LGHPDRLSEVLGIDLVLDGAEHPIGGFSLDLVGKDLTHDAVLIVENQLGGTDHNHLGQILTYAAGSDASTIVWIAKSFREEHRQAFLWLNEQTRENIRFFGVELRAVRIGDSLPAPLLNVVAEPNDWQKRIKTAASAASAGSKAAAYVEFWTKAVDRFREEDPTWTRARKPSDENWMDFPSPIRVKGARISMGFAKGRRLRHELYIDSGNGPFNDRVFGALLALRPTIESLYGRSLEFEELPNRRASRIAEYRPNADVSDVDHHDEYIDWFVDCSARLRRAFSNIELPDLTELEPSEADIARANEIEAYDVPTPAHGVRDEA